MKTLTFALDCQLNDEDYIKEGTVVQVAEDAKQYEGFAAVVITDGWSYDDKPVKFIPFTDHFSKASFVELR